MTVTTKPKPKQQPDKSQVQKLSNKDGRVATEQRSDEPEFFSVLLRIPVDMLAAIDARVKQRRPVRISRQAWIIETLHKRLVKGTK